MLNGYRRDLGIGCGRRAASPVAVSHEASPYCGRRAVEWQHAAVELSGQILFDPFLKTFASRLLPDLSRTSNEFSYGLSSKEKVGRYLGFHPIEYRPVRSWPDGLADNICVEKKWHQPRSTERPADLSRSISSSTSVRGEARSTATNSGPVLAFWVVNIGCNDWRMNWASCPSERRAPAIALRRGASREGTVTSTRLAPLAVILLRWRATRDASWVLEVARSIAAHSIRLRYRILGCGWLESQPQAQHRDLGAHSSMSVGFGRRWCLSSGSHRCSR